MRSGLLVAIGLVATGLVLGGGAPAEAGTQDFTLVNHTGGTVNNLYVSESAKNDWEEDVLGEDVLEDGQSVKVTFSGKDACLWDLMVRDDSGDGSSWRGLNLCEVSTVVLRCNDEECWAETE